MTAAIVMTTVPEGDPLVQALVEGRLAACVQALPITSTYRWDGEVQTDSEVLVLIKTAGDRIDDVQAFLAEHHPYDLPEVLVIDALAGSPSYLTWLLEETRASGL